MLTVTQNIKSLMESRNVSNAELARNVGVDKSTITRWFSTNSEPRGETLAKIAAYFEVPVEYLYRDNEQISEVTKRLVDLYEVSAGRGRSASAPEEYKREKGEYAKVVGDSMHPILHDGDVVRIVETSTVTPTDIALVRINGDENTLKHVEVTKDGVWVRGENKDAFTDKLYTVEECITLPVQIVGKAVEIVSRKL